MDTCSNCNEPINANEEKCPTCGEHVGAPNVRTLDAEGERIALEERYQSAIQRAELRNAQNGVEDFSKAVESSVAVATCGLQPLRTLAESSNNLYTNYYLGVRGEIRRLAEEENDRQRTTVDALLFGSYAKNIRFAALALDGVGLRSYGKDGLAYGLGLREVAIARRASLLEENSFDFVKRHTLGPGSGIPKGRRSSWGNRHKLAVAKLADRIWPETDRAEYAEILLSGSGDRSTDQFIEVHIYGTFNLNAVASVSGASNPKQKVDRAVLAVVKEMLAKRGIKWIEA